MVQPFMDHKENLKNNLIYHFAQYLPTHCHRSKMALPSSIDATYLPIVPVNPSSSITSKKLSTIYPLSTSSTRPTASASAAFRKGIGNLSTGFFYLGLWRAKFQAILRQEDCLNHIYRISPSIPADSENEKFLGKYPVLREYSLCLDVYHCKVDLLFDRLNSVRWNIQSAHPITLFPISKQAPNPSASTEC